MTFNFGFATDGAFYLAADRRRVYEGPVVAIDDSTTKLYEVNRCTYLTASGFLPFVERVVAPQSTHVFGAAPIDTGRLSERLPRLAQQLSGGFAQVASEANAPDPSALFSKFSLAGVAAGGQPFSCEWNSQQGFVGPAIGRRHCFFLPRGDPYEDGVLRERVLQVQQLAIGGGSLRRIRREAQQVLAWVAERDETVSAAGDLVWIRTGGSKRCQLNGRSWIL